MKAIIQFDLPAESLEHQDALNGSQFKIIIGDLLNHIRSKTKYETPSKSKLQVYEELREFILSELESRDLTI